MQVEKQNSMRIIGSFLFSLPVFSQVFALPWFEANQETNPGFRPYFCEDQFCSKSCSKI